MTDLKMEPQISRTPAYTTATHPYIFMEISRAYMKITVDLT